MSVANVNGSAKGNTLMSQSKQDNYEKKIQNQIANLQEKMKNINNNRKMSAEQKSNEKKKIQEQIQDLNSKLRQYQVQKKQKETAEQTDENDNKNDNQITGVSEADSGVIISLSSTKEQIAGMKKIRTNLQGKLRTARTEEEKEALQKKINKVNEDIGVKVGENRETIREYQEAEEEKADSKSDKVQWAKRKHRKKPVAAQEGIFKNSNVKIIT